MPNQSKQSSLIILLLIILGLAGGYMYYAFIASPIAIQKMPIPDKDNLESFKNAHINLPSDDRITSLKTFGESPVASDALGKKDIFAPF